MLSLRCHGEVVLPDSARAVWSMQLQLACIWICISEDLLWLFDSGRARGSCRPFPMEIVHVDLATPSLAGKASATGWRDPMRWVHRKQRKSIQGRFGDILRGLSALHPIISGSVHLSIHRRWMFPPSHHPAHTTECRHTTTRYRRNLEIDGFITTLTAYPVPSTGFSWAFPAPPPRCTFEGP